MAVTYEYVGKAVGGGDVTTVPVGSFGNTDKVVHTVVLDRPSIVSAHLTGFQENAGSTSVWSAPAPSIEVRPPSGGVWGETRFGASLMVYGSAVGGNVPPESQTGNARYLSISAPLPAGEYNIVVNAQGSSRTRTVDTATITVTPNG